MVAEQTAISERKPIDLATVAGTVNAQGGGPQTLEELRVAVDKTIDVDQGGGAAGQPDEEAKKAAALAEWQRLSDKAVKLGTTIDAVKEMEEKERLKGAGGKEKGVWRSELASTAEREKLVIEKDTQTQITERLEEYVRWWRQAQIHDGLEDQELPVKLRYVEAMTKRFRDRMEKETDIFQSAEEVVATLITLEDELYRQAYAWAKQFKVNPGSLKELLDVTDKLTRERRKGLLIQGEEAVWSWLSKTGAKFSEIPSKLWGREKLGRIDLEEIDISVLDPFIEESGFLTRSGQVEYFLRLEGLRGEIIAKILGKANLGAALEDKEFLRLLELSSAAFDDASNPIGTAKNELRHHNATVGAERRLFNQRKAAGWESYRGAESITDLSPIERRRLHLDASDEAVAESLNNLGSQVLERETLSGSTAGTLTGKASEIRTKGRATEGQIKVKGEEIEEAGGEIAEIEGRRATLRGRLYGKGDKIGLEEERAKKDREVEGKWRKLQARNYTDEKIEDLNGLIDNAETRIETLSENRDNARIDEKKLDQELEKLRRRLGKAKEEKDRSPIEGEIAALEIQLEGKKETIASLTKEIDSLTRDSTAYKTKITEIRKEIGEYEQAEGELEKINEEIVKIEEELKGKKEKVKTGDKTKTKVVKKGLESELRTAKSEKKRLEGQLIQMREGTISKDEEQKAQALEALAVICEEGEISRISETVRTGKVSLKDLSDSTVGRLTLLELIYGSAYYAEHKAVIDEVFSDRNILLCLIHFYRPKGISIEEVEKEGADVSGLLKRHQGEILAHSRPEAAEFIIGLLEHRIMAGIRGEPSDYQPFVVRREEAKIIHRKPITVALPGNI